MLIFDPKSARARSRIVITDNPEAGVSFDAGMRERVYSFPVLDSKTAPGGTSDKRMEENGKDVCNAHSGRSARVGRFAG